MRSRFLTFSVALLALAALTVFGPAAAVSPADLTVAAQPSPPLASGSVPAALAGRLDPHGTQILSGGTPLCNLWLLAPVQTVKQSDSSPDVLFGNLQIGTLVGVIQILTPAQDFRHQKVPAGVYTLRYGQIPQDGNHMGVSQYRDFLLLCPVAADTKPDATLAFNDLVTLSRKTAGTGHPAVMSLIPTNSGLKTLPAIFSDDAGDQALQFDLHEQASSGAQDVPAALVIVPGAESGQQ